MPTVENYEHNEATRTNIPREETRDFVSRDERMPVTMRYPRDPSLDPQLVWQGKDEQDGYDLTVPAVPIYIQEEISPRALIADLYDTSRGESDQPHLFPVSVASSLDQTVGFYQHDEQWRNRLILGDSLLVMTSLAEKEGLRGKVQTIYIDPPYGIKFGSNWQVSTRKRDVQDGKADQTTPQPEQIKAFRDTWELGIHSYLSYLRDRLMIARELLTESGSIFVQIGDENVHLVRALLDEIMGSANFVSLITVQKMAGLASRFLKGACDYVIWYAKDADKAKYRRLFNEKTLGVGHGSGARYDQVISSAGERQRLPSNRDDLAQLLDLGWKVFQPTTLTTFGSGGSSYYAFEFQGKQYYPSTGKGWLTTREGMARLAAAGRIVATGSSIRYARHLDDFPSYEINNVWSDIASPPDVVYVVQTHTRVVERCMVMTTDPGDLVLDPTCGSGTTAVVAEQWGRRWITIDTSRVALALARTRLMAAKYPYYLLADSPEGVRKEQEITGITPPEYKTGSDIRKGFVYERVPHVTLKSIANNPEIREGMTRAEIDRAIAKYADTETLYDRPYEDKKKVRVSGPFTVESLSPHRILPPDDVNVDGHVTETEILSREEYETRILKALKSTGVQITYKHEHVNFDELTPFSDPYLNATGTFADASGNQRRVAVSIGPEYGTVGADWIKQAARAATRGIGFDMLIVCGFAFDAQVNEEAKEYGDLTVLPTKMSMELIMQGDGQLKNTGTGNLFMVFGEPDIDVRVEDGMVTVEIRGVDVYDPSTDAVRSNPTAELACWFIDTDYNQDAFFVRHAYFTGGNEPYDRLRKTLRAEIDADAWQSLYSTTSRPFPIPKSGHIAVKAINHYGDEVMKVIDLGRRNEN